MPDTAEDAILRAIRRQRGTEGRKPAAPSASPLEAAVARHYTPDDGSTKPNPQKTRHADPGTSLAEAIDRHFGIQNN